MYLFNNIAYLEVFGIIHLFLSNDKFKSLITDINQLIKEIIVEIFNKTLTNSDEKIDYDYYKGGSNPLKEKHDHSLDEKFDSNNLKKHIFYNENYNDNSDDDDDYQYLNDDTSNSKTLNNNKDSRSNSSSSYQKVSLNDGTNMVPTGDKLNVANNPNPYQNYGDEHINYQDSNEFLDDNKDFLVGQPSEEDTHNIYKNKYRSSKYQYKTKRPLSTGSNYKRKSSLRSNRDNDNKSNAFKRLSNSFDTNNIIGKDKARQLDYMKYRISEKIPKTKLKEINYAIKSKFNKNVIYNILKRLQIIISEVQK